MDDALELLDLAVCGVAMFGPASLLDCDLRDAVIDIQRHIDRLKVLHAGFVHEADQRRIWSGHGHRSVADWLAAATNTSRSEAHSRARLGEALHASDTLKKAAEQGDLSAAAAEALREAVANRPDGASENDVNDLVNACKGADPRDAKDAAETWKRSLSSETPEQAQQRRYAKRSLTTRNLGDGMGQLIATMPLHDLRQVTNTISHLAGTPSEDDARTTEQRLLDGLVQLCVAYAKGQVTGGREKPTLLITIAADDYTGRSHGDGFTAHGDRIPAHVVRFLAEEANLQRVLQAGSHVLDLGRTVRWASDAHYTALVARDGGCRWPGCHIPAAWCDIDHLHAWEHGGHSDLDNLVLWCRHHHTTKHRIDVKVLGDANNLRLQLPDGTTIHCPPNSHTTRRQPRPPTHAAA